MTWLGHVLGLDDASGPAYLFWSGVGADLTEAALLVGAWNWIRRHNCHVRGCWRVGRHAVADTGHVVCQRHHPDGAPSAADIHRSAR